MLLVSLEKRLIIRPNIKYLYLIAINYKINLKWSTPSLPIGLSSKKRTKVSRTLKNILL
jgi:hypothetical protein